MSKQSLLEQLKSNVEVRDILEWPFDFNLTVSTEEKGWFQVKPSAKMDVIACDGTGGIFLLYGVHEHLMHITSEGQAGIIARNLDEGLKLMIAQPDWRDLLKFSGGGKLEEMKRVAPYLKRDIEEDQPEIEEQRSLLIKKLALGEAEDPIALLHEAVVVLGKGITVYGPDGSAFIGLFGEFTVESNPSWR